MIEIPVILGQDLKEYLLEVSKHVLHNGLYQYSEDHSDLHVFSILDSDLLDKSYVDRILSSTDHQCRLFFLSYPPYGINPWHHDTASNGYRKSCVTWNLMPDTAEIAPTEFKDSMHYYNSNGFILDTRKRHQMNNGKDERHLFQMAFGLDPEDVGQHFLRKII